MLDQVSDELRNTNITTKITRWLNMSIIDLATIYVFGHLHKYFSKATTPSSPDITMDTDFLWLKTIEIPSQNTKLWPGDESRLSESYPKYRTQQGTISEYYMNGIILSLWQVPGASVLTVTGAYQKRPLKLLDTLSVTCDLPEEWHNLVTQKATTRGYDYEGNTEGSLKSEKKEKPLLFQLGTAVHKRLDETLVLGPASGRSRPARPRLPSNYPAPRY